MLDLTTLKVDKKQDHIAYNDEYHVYWNMNTLEKYTSVTTFIAQFKFDVDWDKIKEAISKRDGIPVSQITEKWEKAKSEGCEYGSHYHEFEEHSIIANEGLKYEAKWYPYLTTLPRDILDGVLVEQILYSDKLKLAGQADLIILSNGYSHVLDYKTNKKLDKKGHIQYDTREPQRMKSPVGHLECCSFNHYRLQLNIYHAMLRKMRPMYKRGNRRILYLEDTYSIDYMHEEMLSLGLYREHAVK